MISVIVGNGPWHMPDELSYSELSLLHGHPMARTELLPDRVPITTQLAPPRSYGLTSANIDTRTSPSGDEPLLPSISH